jgi:ABC-type xylose transport system permease subunit
LLAFDCHRTKSAGDEALLGGRGKMIHALLGGFVIAAVFNGSSEHAS